MPAEHRVELCTAMTVFEYWNQLATPYLNDNFIPSLNKYHTSPGVTLEVI